VSRPRSLLLAACAAVVLGALSATFVFVQSDRLDRAKADHARAVAGLAHSKRAFVRSSERLRNDANRADSAAKILKRLAETASEISDDAARLVVLGRGEIEDVLANRIDAFNAKIQEENQIVEKIDRSIGFLLQELGISYDDHENFAV
jgi:hypothetical protein